VRSPKPLPSPPATAVWRVVAFLVALSTVRYALVDGGVLEARRDQLLDEQREQVRQERRLFWRMVAISTFVAIVVAARLVTG
jgi:Na+/H+ antiporter NhaD/arsenite permease-like protein